jgi:AraC family transcriptional regulator, regulatory protein of adaptative response / methylated-DNA-[protein]-cysteine methyltransferase
MALMNSETAPQLTPAATNANAAANTLSHAASECALGLVLVARSAKGVCAILIGAGRDELQAELAARFPEAKLVANEAAVHDDLVKVIRFVDKPAEGLHLTLDMRGTPFQRRVWEKLRAMPAGTTMSYTEVARSIGAPDAVRAVAGACAANPIALAIPCHRVVRSNGDLAGYRWGVERKRELIRREAAA